MDNNCTFATLRLGKTSVADITMINNLSAGVLNPVRTISVVCTQVPQELNEGTYVFIWLGSDNSKGIATEWKQGFKAVGKVTGIQRGEKYNDESTTTVEIGYVFADSVSRLDILREAPSAYYWCSSMPIIGLDDHSNQTIRCISVDGERSDIKAFFHVIESVLPDSKLEIVSAYPELEEYFSYIPRDPHDDLVDATNPAVVANGVARVTNGTNTLLYGVPGAGKSWTIAREYCSDETRMERLVFHPDYTYSDFVGQIMPKVEDGSVSYRFVPGPFTKLLKRAYENPGIEYFLIIEEINRGNAPAIFGEVFQLLDRKAEPDASGYPVGTSEYGITNENVASVVYGDPDRLVRIPSNMSIIGTMNTSDQNVFTLDTAFQRRWNMRLIENTFEGHRFADNHILDTDVSWRQFCAAINREILKSNVRKTSSEDKRLGAFFITAADLVFNAAEDDDNATEAVRIRARRDNRRFAEKVIKYLWDDAFKFNRENVFETNSFISLEQLIREFMDRRGNDRFRIFKEGMFNAIVDQADGTTIQ